MFEHHELKRAFTELQASEYRGLCLCARRTAARGATTAQTAAAATQTVEVTGFTTEKLLLKLDDGKEMTFVVDIAGDKERKWQKDFATLSRITVTYGTQAPGGPPIATSLKNAAGDGKK
jgi:hypothetical protein